MCHNQALAQVLDSRFGLLLSLTSSMFRAQLPFAASLKGATRASYFQAQARSCDEVGPGRGARATHDLDYPCSLPRQHSEGSYHSLRILGLPLFQNYLIKSAHVMLTSNLWVV